MANNIIRTNEQQLKTILKECVEKILLEIDHREATEPLADNMNAQNEMGRGISDTNILSKRTQLILFGWVLLCVSRFTKFEDIKHIVGILL